MSTHVNIVIDIADGSNPIDAAACGIFANVRVYGTCPVGHGAIHSVTISTVIRQKLNYEKRN